MFAKFPLFQSHLDVAHKNWMACLDQGSIAIDATCGNGHDTLFLAQNFCGKEGNTLYGYDIQNEAIESTEAQLGKSLDTESLKRVTLECKSHEEFRGFRESSVCLIVYNLGYLPGGDKSLTTQTEITLKSLRSALPLISEGGCISVTCYPGHEEGAKEEEAILKFLSELDPRRWSVCHHKWLNRRKSPSLLLIQKGLVSHS